MAFSRTFRRRAVSFGKPLTVPAVKSPAYLAGAAAHAAGQTMAENPFTVAEWAQSWDWAEGWRHAAHAALFSTPIVMGR
jgi:hypothetical protein